MPTTRRLATGFEAELKARGERLAELRRRAGRRTVSGVELVEVQAAEEGWRLDRWAKARFPTLGFGQLQKLCRTGQFRVDGKRVEAGVRLQPGPDGARAAGGRRAAATGDSRASRPCGRRTRPSSASSSCSRTRR